MGIESIPVYVPDKWSAAWFRTFIAEVLAKLDTRNALGTGVTITSDGNSVATLDIGTTVSDAVDAHNDDAASHTAAFAAHVALADPHGQYATDTDLSDHVAAANPHPGYLTQAEADALYVDQSATTVADATGGSTVDTECRAQLNALLAVLRTTGAIGT